jgi:hypothetical protein
MADAKGVATVVQSALQEIGMTGKLEVSKDGAQIVAPLDGPPGEPVRVVVEVENLAGKER